MTIYYSQSNKGFYHSELHGTNVPEDVVEISEQEYNDLQSGHLDMKQIATDENGRPILVNQDVSILSYAEKRQREYPPMENYLDGLVKDDQAQIDKYISDCLAVKAKYPKE
jgi:hypothetical protein